MERPHHVHKEIGMNQKVRMLGLLAAIAVSSSSIGAVVDTDMPLNVSWDGSPPTPDSRTWVNVLFRDFSGAGSLGNFEWIRNAVELQITTDSLTHGNQAPVVGHGSLLTGEDVRSLWLKFNPNKDISKLKIYWTGSSMTPGVPTNADTFPDAGLQPSDISLGAKFDKTGADGLFDIKLEWKDSANKLGPADPNHSFSKLLLVYDGGKTKIDASDFSFGSAPDKGSKFGPFHAVAHIGNIPTSGEDSGWIAAVP
jgi:hypothetical protein